MDFKSLMSAQISKAKAPSSTANGTSSASKFVRRADIEAERQKAYAEEQARLEAKREERAAKKRKLEDEEAERSAEREAKLKKLSEAAKARREAEEREKEGQRRKRLGLPDLATEGNDSKAGGAGREEQNKEVGHDIPSDDELGAKLRALSEPAALLGESYGARLARYHQRLGKSALSKETPAPLALPIVWSKGPIPTRLEPVEEKQMLLADEPPKSPSKEELLMLYRQIGSYLTLLLSEWSTSLSLRPTAVKESSTGRAAYQSYMSVLRDLTPLYRKLEEQSLDPDLLTPLCEIISHIQKRQYVKANDAYLRLSIGKAAWPIGVTMVGIHERSAREKLHESDKQAHILSDEVTRKMLQSLKRCISFAQTRWPPDDLGQLMG
ncbi:hypothetical protein DV736_g621, partial [Chaetothyriales sp. CBS 134916]